MQAGPKIRSVNVALPLRNKPSSHLIPGIAGMPLVRPCSDNDKEIVLNSEHLLFLRAVLSHDMILDAYMDALMTLILK